MGHSHHHGHSPAHHHDHDGASSGQRMAWAFFLNLSFTIIEFVGGLLTNSVAIMADAVHDLGDSLSIGLAWWLGWLSGRPEDARFSYGYRRLSLLGALINASILVAGSLWILIESIPRLFDPEMPVAEGMLLLSILGIAVNGFAAWKLSAGQTLNERVLNWHLLEDVLGWVAVLLISITLMFVDLPILDPLLSIAFTLFILLNVLKALRETIYLFLQGVPSRRLREEIITELGALDPIEGIHHLHFWSLDGEHHVLTAHLVLYEELTAADLQKLKSQVAQRLTRFKLAHTTIEIEYPQEGCRDGHPESS